MAAATGAAAFAISLPLPLPFASLPLARAAAIPRRLAPLVISRAAAAVAPFSLSKGLLLPPSVSLKPLRLRTTAAAAPGDAVPSEAIVENAQKVVPAAADDGVTSTVISSLLFIAFVGLSILTVGVIYIAVTDFLQKREREKFEKEEAAKKKKKGGKKVKARSRAAPRGFGQKVEEIDEDDD
ncbi:hypothetical protein Taro_003312 [Colocasia esculenta]|uniref:Uncharacterized protein n=1 Tax=Colocasia esculenta TaxID=4460 RepID=A0A843TJF8_COLES|nr:hypothetical protein [Colocasia esculenta]